MEKENDHVDNDVIEVEEIGECLTRRMKVSRKRKKR